MKTVYFHSTWESESDLESLENIRKQTPSGSGSWGEIRGIPNRTEADYHIAFNRVPPSADPDRLLLFSAEPPCSAHYGGWDEMNALEIYPLDTFFKPQRWWISRTYDGLKGSDIPGKTKDLSWITTDKGRELTQPIKGIRELLLRFDIWKHQSKKVPLVNRGGTDGHILRMKFLDRLTEQYPQLLNLYGRGDFSGPYYHGEVEDKWDGLVDYRYSLAIENYTGPNYFSEKLTDALLAWCMPIYWGCTNLDEYLPEDSYAEIDIEDPNAPQRVREIVESDIREQNLDAIAEARRRLLDELQVWPVVERRIQELESD